jgi:hypothetical protein
MSMMCPPLYNRRALPGESMVKRVSSGSPPMRSHTQNWASGIPPILKCLIHAYLNQCGNHKDFIDKTESLSSSRDSVANKLAYRGYLYFTIIREISI